MREQIKNKKRDLSRRDERLGAGRNACTRTEFR
jgi:hypothetical protein